MCGLTGFIDYTGSSSSEILKKMTDALFHRGPDDAGYEVRSEERATIGFGFRRLSIIDLSAAGHQPMVNEANGDMIIFNGEIYNYRELKIELEKKGHNFKSNSDTEVILKSFQEWGVLCVDRFVGMFVIVIYNPSKSKIHIFRDRAGVKPFFYYTDGNIFLFASELKALHQHDRFLRKINFNALKLYFYHGYIPAPHCIFENTYKLPAGTRLEFDLKKNQHSVHTYWSSIDAFNRPKLNISYAEATEQLDDILTRAFRYRMVSDVPVGVFLSGGYDSSCVAALLSKNGSQPLKTFTISFENEKFNEGRYARAVADHLGTDHTDYKMQEKDAMDLVPLLPDIYDEPLADGGAIPNVLVSQLAKEKVKVVLSADGGDEIFAGYIKHQYALKQHERYFRYPSLLKKTLVQGIKTIDKFRKKSLLHYDSLSRIGYFMDAKDTGILFDRLNQTFSDSEIDLLLKNSLTSLHNNFMNNHLLNENNDEINRIVAIDYLTYLAGDILPKVDCATSFASIEGREPLLDHNIVEFAATLPSSFKLRNGVGKSILRSVVHKYIPKEIMERPKMGFGLPIDDWGRNELKLVFDECFDNDFLERQQIFSVPDVRNLYLDYQSGNMKNFDKVYEIFIFQQWYKRWMS